jgi:exopolysaccharide production protein ExoY
MRLEKPEEGTRLPNSLSLQLLLPIALEKQSHVRHAPLGGRTKRGFDITLALAAIIILLPIIVLTALLIKLTDGGSIVYRHKRIGFGGREFDCLKFRTMAPNGDEILQRHFERFPEARQEWLETRKLTHDPRVTAIGAVLRKLSLDELPQLINILQGEMSVVGPRPVVRDELAMYGAHSALYLQTRPGLTGAWQISGRSDTTYSQRVALDAQYVATWSLMTDFWIIICTVPAVALAKGSR